MLFAALLRLSGLTPAHAAHHLGVRRRMVNYWLSPEGGPSDVALNKVYDLIDRQEHEAEAIIRRWDEAGRPDTLEVELPADDEDARAEGWPSVEARAVPLAIAQATLIHVRISATVAENRKAAEEPEAAEIVEEDD